MTNEEAIVLFGSIQFDLTDGYYQREDYTEALCVFDRLNQENTKLKAENEEYNKALTTWNNANNEMLKFNQELKDEIELLKSENERLKELAVTIMCPAEYDLDFDKKKSCGGEMNNNCRKCCLEWLQSEAERSRYVYTV